jgi:nitrilase
MQHIAMEGRCFVLGCNQYFHKTMYPEEFQPYVKDEPEDLCPGGSLIVAPDGEILAGPLVGEAGVLRAELELEEIIRQKLDFDPVGHYDRPDVFRFEVRKEGPGNLIR